MTLYDVSGNPVTGYYDAPYTDTECRTAFMAEVNKKALSIGMTSSNFAVPSGASTQQQTTAKDMALLTLIASCYKEMAEVWSKDSYTIVPRNRNVSIVVDTTVHDTTLEANYPILGGKTGSYSGSNTLACVCDVDGKQVAGYIAGASTSVKRFSAMKQLMDIASTVLAGGTNTDTVTDATNAIAYEIPTYYTLNYEQQTLTPLYAQSETTSIIPASTVKIITALTMLDWVEDIHETFQIIDSDMIGGSGAVFAMGDVISFKDALYAMMLPSSNMAAHAVARAVGAKILTLGQ